MRVGSRWGKPGNVEVCSVEKGNVCREQKTGYICVNGKATGVTVKMQEAEVMKVEEECKESVTTC